MARLSRPIVEGRLVCRRRGRTAGTDRVLLQLSGPGVRTLTERFVIPRAEADQS